MNKEVDDAVAQGTPRTDEEEFRAYGQEGGDSPYCMAVDSEFARRLETEVVEYKRQADGYYHEAAIALDKLGVAKRENAALSAQVVELQKELAEAKEEIVNLGYELKEARS